MTLITHQQDGLFKKVVDIMTRTGNFLGQSSQSYQQAGSLIAMLYQAK